MRISVEILDFGNRNKRVISFLLNQLGRYTTSYFLKYCSTIVQESLRIGHVRYINILTWLRGFQVKPLYLVLFSLYLYLRALTIRPKISKFSKRGQIVWKFRGKSSRKYGNCWISEKRTIQPKIPEISGMKVKWDGNFQEKIFRKFGYTSRGSPLFRNFCKFPIFYSALASSFGCDHNSELDISCKDGAHSIKETL